MWEDNGVPAVREGGSDDATFWVNGSQNLVHAGEVLRDVVIGFARSAGYGKFRFYINDVEVAPQDAPEFVQARFVYKVVPYDSAG